MGQQPMRDDSASNASLNHLHDGHCLAISQIFREVMHQGGMYHTTGRYCFSTQAFHIVDDTACIAAVASGLIATCNGTIPEQFVPSVDRVLARYGVTDHSEFAAC
jgi:hypothetical protein